MPDINDRLEDRQETSLLAQVSTSTNQYLALLCDVSRSGGRLQLKHPLAIGSEMTVRLKPNVERTGVVRRCQPAPGTARFDIGFELMGAHWPDELLPD